MSFQSIKQANMVYGQMKRQQEAFDNYRPPAKQDDSAADLVTLKEKVSSLEYNNKKHAQSLQKALKLIHDGECDRAKLFINGVIHQLTK